MALLHGMTLMNPPVPANRHISNFLTTRTRTCSIDHSHNQHIFVAWRYRHSDRDKEWYLMKHCDYLTCIIVIEQSRCINTGSCDTILDLAGSVHTEN